MVFPFGRVGREFERVILNGFPDRVFLDVLRVEVLPLEVLVDPGQAALVTENIGQGQSRLGLAIVAKLGPVGGDLRERGWGKRREMRH